MCSFSYIFSASHVHEDKLLAFHQQFRRVDIFFERKRGRFIRGRRSNHNSASKGFPSSSSSSLLDVCRSVQRYEKMSLQNANDYDLIEALSREQREWLYSRTEQSSRKRERMVLRMLTTSLSSSSSSRCCCSPRTMKIKA